MTNPNGDVQHHLGYAYHMLNDRRLMWIEYLEERIETCRERLRDSGKRAVQEEREEPETPAAVEEHAGDADEWETPLSEGWREEATAEEELW